MARRTTPPPAKVDTTSGEEKKRSGEPAEVVVYWCNEITAARKREEEYREEGQKIIDIYDGKKSESVPFNVLFSNTETLLPAVYSAVPRPVVERRFKDNDPLGKAAALAGQRGLEFLLDTNVEGYETFDQGMRAAVLDALLPGRGITCVKYDAVIGALPQPSASDTTGAPAEATPYKSSELVCLDTRQWNRVYFGYAKKWSKVPWVAYEEHLDKEEATRLFGDRKAKELVFTEADDEDKEDEKRTDAERNKGSRKTCLVYQIWDKDDKKLRYISPQYHEGYLKEDDDSLQLTGFFNCPRPIQFVEKNDLLPVALYCLYENQAKELNQLTLRINRIVRAIKARGIYDSELGEDIKKLFEADDNEMVPADKSSSLAAEKGLQNAIWFAPIDVLMSVLEKLYQAREQCKRVIYEIMGIADIIRGVSQASETLGAQQIKESWGKLRINKLQKEVQRYARDLLRMMLELAATKFSEETWAKMTGLPFVTTQQRNQLEQLSKVVQGQAAQMAAAGQQPTQQQMQQVQQLQAEMAKPVWGQVLAMLRDDTQRAYRIDIETNSTVEPEAAEDQKQIADLMTAIGQYLNGVGPMVAKGIMPFGVAQSMLLAITRRFRFGSEIEEFIQQMQPPKPEDDGKAAEAAKLQAEQKKSQDELQQQGVIEKAAHDREVTKEQNRAAGEAAKIQADQVIKTAEIAATTQREAQKLDSDRRTRQMELQADRATEEMKAKIQQDTELKKAALQIAGQIEVANINAAVKAQAAEGEQKQAQASEHNNEKMMERLMASQEKLLKAVSAPRERIPTREGGKIVKIVDRAVT